MPHVRNPVSRDGASKCTVKAISIIGEITDGAWLSKNRNPRTGNSLRATKLDIFVMKCAIMLVLTIHKKKKPLYFAIWAMLSAGEEAMPKLILF